MNLKITNQLNTSTGKPITNAYCNLSVNTDVLMTSLKVIYEPEFWIDAEAKENKYDRVVPVLLDDNEKIIKRIGSFSVQLTEEQALAFNPIHAYEHARDYMVETFGWVVVIEQK